MSRYLKLLIISSQTLFLLWTLSFSKPVIPPFCVSEKLTAVHIHLFELLVATYPLVLVITACILIKLHTRNFAIVRNLFKPIEFLLKKANCRYAVTTDAVFRTFASLFLISNINVMVGFLKLVDATYVTNSTGIHQRHVLFIDPTVEFFGTKHIMRILIAILPYLLFSLLPSLLLLIYPTQLYRFLSKFLSSRKQLVITAFAEAIYSCFKDGLNGTTDYRALAAINLLLLIPFGSFYSFVSSLIGYPKPIINLFVLILTVCVISFLKPCKEMIANISIIFHFALYSIIYFNSYLWRNDPSVGTFTLELTFIATGLVTHLLVALWVSYNFTKLAEKKLKLQFCGHGSTMYSLNCILERFRDIYRRYRHYQELQEQ